MKKKTLRSLFSLLMALVLGISLLTGCSGKAAERAEMQEDAETIQVYLWTNSLYETYAPYVQAQLPDVNIEFIVGNNDLDFYKFLQENGGLPDIITSCRFSLHDAAPLKDSLMNLATTNEAGAVYNAYLLEGLTGCHKAVVIGRQRDAVLLEQAAVDHESVGVGAHRQPVHAAVLIFEAVEENDWMKKKRLYKVFALLAAMVLSLSLLTGCAGKSTEAVQAQEDAETIQVYLWTNNLYEKYAPYVQ